jgi:hypothetical protein
MPAFASMGLEMAVTVIVFSGYVTAKSCAIDPPKE